MKRQKGITLMELALVVGFSSLLVGIAITGASSARADMRAEAQVSVLRGIVAHVRENYWNPTRMLYFVNDAGVTNAYVTDDLAREQAVPEDWMNASGSSVINPYSRYGDSVLVGYNYYVPSALRPPGGAYASIGIRLTNIAAEHCSRLVNSLSSLAQAIQINSTVVKNRGQVFSSASTVTACGSSDWNTIFIGVS